MGEVFLDATETGELLPLTGTEYRLGAESKSQTNEPNALDGDPEPENVQGITWCAALGWDPEGDHTIEKPAEYDFWKDFQPVGWPDKLLSFTMLHVQKGEPVHFPLFSEDWFNLFSYRQIVQPAHHKDAREAATIMNWPMNDYYIGTILDVDAEVAAKRLKSSKQLTLSMLYWLQTEHGYRGLRLRGDLTGTSDGLAKAAYIRESRRIEARFTVLEQHIAAYTNSEATLAPEMPASVGVGAYRIDLHPSTNERPTLDTSTLPFQIPLGALIPVRIRNLIPACKNIGVTHITNGCYRLHPIEWNIGEVAGLLAWHCLEKKLETSQVLANAENVIDFQSLCHSEGIEIAWPKFRAL
ncbi:FAD-dependent oxidoreductase [Geitlerinema splendidum]|nr:FAD-dependent oxidoreductase [Geitlerinema splendidum]